MKVYVVMGNDYPECVFESEAAAEAFVESKINQQREIKDQYKKKQLSPLALPAGARIYWRWYEFELQKERACSKLKPT